MSPGSRENRFPLRVAVRRTGLKADLIRAWERRYGAIRPERSAGNQRLFSEADLSRLIRLRDAVRLGLSIAQIADMADDDLARLVDGLREDVGPAIAVENGQAPKPALESAVAAIRGLDSVALRRELETQLVELGRLAFLERFVLPLMERIGELYGAGELRIAHEHLASAAVRAVLETLQPAYPPDTGAPQLLVATPRGQHHELAAMAVAATARLEGWRVTYLGVNVPAEELAAAARTAGARVTALSITLAGDAELPEELGRLGTALPGKLLVGGAAVPHYEATLEGIGAQIVGTLGELRRVLDALRVELGDRDAAAGE